MKERRAGAVKSPHIGGDLERVDVSFASFLCAKEKEVASLPKKKRFAAAQLITQQVTQRVTDKNKKQTDTQHFTHK
ncbi:MAG: hypothetical protein IJ562_01660 [Prevotella sp.]|nr:hypothetical protein [Prevotella sp.]